MTLGPTRPPLRLPAGIWTCPICGGCWLHPKGCDNILTAKKHPLPIINRQERHIMNERIEWETPEIEAITDTESRADQADISVRNGVGPSSGFPS